MCSFLCYTIFMKKLECMVEPLMNWYHENKRDLPWRCDHEFYHVWISEIMLQQTRVEAVISYYKRFLKKCPTVEDLANISLDELLKLWEGLGYYSRARNLQKAAKIVVQEGIPTNKNDLLKLPGIGTYTSSAIASICFGEKVSAVDGNFLRILSRVLLDPSDMKDDQTKKKYTTLLDQIIPTYSPGDFNQAMMDLGATVCLPNGMPKCEVCPLSFMCKAYQEKKQLEYPIRMKKIKQKIIEKTVFIIVRDGKIAICKRKDTGLLASMYELPNTDTYYSDIDLENELYDHGISFRKLSVLPEAKHVFTHLIWYMKGFYFESDNIYNEHFIWVTKEELFTKYSIPTAFKKYLDWIQKDSTQK